MGNFKMVQYFINMLHKVYYVVNFSLQLTDLANERLEYRISKPKRLSEMYERSCYKMYLTCRYILLMFFNDTAGIKFNQSSGFPSANEGIDKSLSTHRYMRKHKYTIQIYERNSRRPVKLTHKSRRINLP